MTDTDFKDNNARINSDNIGRVDGPHDDLESGINPANTPGSTQPDTLAGFPSEMAGATPGREPKSVFPDETVDFTKEGTAESGVTRSQDSI